MAIRKNNKIQEASPERWSPTRDRSSVGINGPRPESQPYNQNRPDVSRVSPQKGSGYNQEQNYQHNNRVQAENTVLWSKTRDRTPKRSGSPVYPQRQGNLPISSSNGPWPGATRGDLFPRIVKWGFIALFLIEVYYCYMWLIQPLMPLIQNIIANQGVPSVSYSMSGYDIAHPLGNFSVGGMSGDNALILFKNTSIRIALFGFIFGITGKAYRMVIMMIRS